MSTVLELNCKQETTFPDADEYPYPVSDRYPSSLPSSGEPDSFDDYTRTRRTERYSSVLTETEGIAAS